MSSFRNGATVNFKTPSPKGSVEHKGGKVTGEKFDGRGLKRIEIELAGKTYSPLASQVSIA
jgi:hypothetical protein